MPDAATAAVTAAEVSSPAGDLSWRRATPRATLRDARSADPLPSLPAAAPAADAQRAGPPATATASLSRKPVVDDAPAHQASYDWPADLQTPAPPMAAIRPPASDPASEVKVHIVVDGDSLARLAGRYLGDPHRGEEIYRLNRDVLANPDLLPIGAKLKIPSRAQSDETSRELSESRFGAMPQRELVPVHPLPDNMAPAVPRARLLQPQPAG